GDGTVDTGYYVKETAAPKGYRINKNNFAVMLSEDYDFAKDNPVVITVSDTLLPAIATAVSGNGMIISIAVAAAGIVIVVLLALNEEKKRLKNQKQKH
ncbi:MAG: SpaA isopeptide-forming pilin-related protein, partial [Erysipelotrichaceae bacterium]|nr:SpaA isopeptide-forming pilin-related protein [Erysipelotrichaceae bacterium]